MSFFMNAPPTTDIGGGKSYGYMRPSSVARATASMRSRYQPFRPGDASFVGGPRNSGENLHFAGEFGMGSSYSGGDGA